MERRKFLQYASAGSLGALTANGAPTTVHTGILGTQHSHTTGKLQAMKASPDYEVGCHLRKRSGGEGAGAKDLRFQGLRWMTEEQLLGILLEVKEGTPLNEKSVASIGTVSLMNSPALSITTGAQDAPRLDAGQVIASRETVTIDDMARKLSGIADNAASPMTQVQRELKVVSGQAQVLLANLNDATGPTNRRQIEEILQQVNAPGNEAVA